MMTILIGGATLNAVRLRPYPLAFVPDDKHFILAFDIPAGDRIECWCPKRLSCPKIEAGVMPWAAHRLVDDKAFGERPMIVSAVGGNGEYLILHPHQYDLLAIRMTDECSSSGHVMEGNSLAEIRSFQLFFIWCHHRLLSPGARPFRVILVAPDNRLASSAILAPIEVIKKFAGASFV